MEIWWTLSFGESITKSEQIESISSSTSSSSSFFSFSYFFCLALPRFYQTKIGLGFYQDGKKWWLGKTVPFHTSFGKPFHQTSYRVEDPLSWRGRRIAKPAREIDQSALRKHFRVPPSALSTISKLTCHPFAKVDQLSTVFKSILWLADYQPIRKRAWEMSHTNMGGKETKNFPIFHISLSEVTGLSILFIVYRSIRDERTERRDQSDSRTVPFV